MTWMQTTTGRAIDLLDPRPEDIDFANDLSPALARLCRFAGALPHGHYSVAQHCVLGADALFAETQNRELAAAFLLHDAHEAYLGDIISPVLAAIAALGGQGGVDALKTLKRNLDQAICAAAGTVTPLAVMWSPTIRRADLRMLAAERRQILSRSPKPWHPSVEDVEPMPLRGRIKLWPWPKAAEEWLARLDRYCPNRPTFPAAARAA